MPFARRLSPVARRQWVVALMTLAPVAARAQSVQPPLAAFVSQRIIVMPVQLLRADTGALVTAATWSAFRKTLDDSIGAAIAARGLGKKWGYAADVARSAKRNVEYVSDPYSLGVEQLRGVGTKPGDPVPPTLASNLRSHIALGDTRYALVPVELTFERKSPNQRAVLRLVLIDGRGAVFVWAGDVASAWMDAYSPALIVALASRIADLVVAP